jgi:AcrR family transcriptional regulator
MKTQPPADRIREYAHDLMMQYGVRSVSMDDIARGAGISKKTIYQHYADKHDLVQAVIRDKIAFNQQCCTQDLAGSRDAVHEVLLCIARMQDMFAQMHPSLIYDLQKFHPAAYALIQDHRYRFWGKVFTENIERGIREELYRPEVQVEVLVKARLENMMLAFNPQLYPNNRFRPVDVQTQLTEHFLFGMASLKGHKLILKYQQERNKKTHP